MFKKMFQREVKEEKSISWNMRRGLMKRLATTIRGIPKTKRKNIRSKYGDLVIQKNK